MQWGKTACHTLPTMVNVLNSQFYVSHGVECHTVIELLNDLELKYEIN